MNELIELIQKHLNVSGEQAQGGAAVLFNAAKEKLGAGEFTQLLGDLPGLAELMSQAPPAGAGLGGLLGGLAGRMGGNAALIGTVMAGFGKLGLSVDDARRFVPVILDFLRHKVGPDVVARLEQTLRA